MWADGNTTGGTLARIIVCWGWILETGVWSLTHPGPGGWAGPGSAALQHWKHCPEEWWPGDAESASFSPPALSSAGLSQCRGVPGVNTHQTSASPLQLPAQHSPPQHVSSAPDYILDLPPENRWRSFRNPLNLQCKSERSFCTIVFPQLCLENSD